MKVAPPHEQTLFTHTYKDNKGTISQNLRVLFSNFGKEDFQRFALNLLC